jgi:hypothetical protein
VSTIYEYVRHPRLDQLRNLRPIKLRDLRGVNSDNWIVRLNARIGLRITVIVGTMWCAYVFTILALISFPAAIRSHDKIIILAWIAQTFLQLVLLPIIIVGQNVISATQDARAEADHETLTALHQMNVQQLQILGQQEQILELLETTLCPAE